MNNVALLIGVSEYEAKEMKPLRSPSEDVKALERVLKHPEMGGFSETGITMLVNPNPQQMRVEINALFSSNRDKGDFLVFYFSGHGLVDDAGYLYLTSTKTDKKLLQATAMPAYDIHKLMKNCRSKHQVVILDCCFSGAFEPDMGIKGEEVNIKDQLSGSAGWAVLTSCNRMEYSSEDKKSGLSVYTKYLVEGIESGVADRDGDGKITVDELYSYVSEKVKKEFPNRNPKLYTKETGYRISLSKAPVRDPSIVYRKEVEDLVQKFQGALSRPVLIGLNELRKRLNLKLSEAENIPGVNFSLMRLGQ